MQGIRHTDGSQTRVEPHKVLSLVSSDVDVLVIYDNEGSYKEISEGISRVPGRDRTGGFQETSADPSKCDHDGVEKTVRVSRNNNKARESILEEDLAKNVSLSLHNSFF